MTVSRKVHTRGTGEIIQSSASYMLATLIACMLSIFVSYIADVNLANLLAARPGNNPDETILGQMIVNGLASVLAFSVILSTLQYVILKKTFLIAWSTRHFVGWILFSVVAWSCAYTIRPMSMYSSGLEAGLIVGFVQSLGLKRMGYSPTAWVLGCGAGIGLYGIYALIIQPWLSSCAEYTPLRLIALAIGFSLLYSLGSGLAVGVLRRSQ